MAEGRYTRFVTMHSTLAVGLLLAGRRCVVVGEGEHAAERSARLVAAKADVMVVRPADYRAEVVAGAWLVLALDGGTIAAVVRDARAGGALVYAQDRPELSDLSMPAVVRRGPLAIAISTDGVAPALSRRLREEFAALLDRSGPALDALVLRMAELRAALPAGKRRETLTREATRVRVDGVVHVDPPTE